MEISDLIEAATQTYDLEMMIEPNSFALTKAIEGALAKYEQIVIERIAAAADSLAESLLAEQEPSYESAEALKLFAHDVREGIPLLGDYSPKDGDIAEVILSGEVTVYENECTSCGAPIEKTEFSILDTKSGQEYFFEDGVHIRLISRGAEEYL